ncbi:uncharacterized protein DDB_G0271670-like [Mercenaria mercenaria]|uniref:uncharacterized protein DDB_G0271670-like n=1 Tax=Mercenaria mercenaria TaxID=6596 RepID=UPI00234F0C5D|nr:uncharacterized protein DDB_G0271670-like [Mercenaria mercenaria]
MDRPKQHALNALLLAVILVSLTEGQHTIANVTLQELFFSSPGYIDSLDYGVNMTRDYRFSTNYPGHTLVLRVVEFVLEAGDKNGKCLYDKVLIYDGYNQSAPVLQELCGTISPGTTYTTSDDTVYVVFTSDHSNNFKGFNIAIVSDGPIITTTTVKTTLTEQTSSTRLTTPNSATSLTTRTTGDRISSTTVSNYSSTPSQTSVISSASISRSTPTGKTTRSTTDISSHSTSNPDSSVSTITTVKHTTGTDYNPIHSYSSTSSTPATSQSRSTSSTSLTTTAPMKLPSTSSFTTDKTSTSKTKTSATSTEVQTSSTPTRNSTSDSTVTTSLQTLTSSDTTSATTDTKSTTGSTEISKMTTKTTSGPPTSAASRSTFSYSSSRALSSSTTSTKASTLSRQASTTVISTTMKTGDDFPTSDDTIWVIVGCCAAGFILLIISSVAVYRYLKQKGHRGKPTSVYPSALSHDIVGKTVFRKADTLQQNGTTQPMNIFDLDLPSPKHKANILPPVNVGSSIEMV